MSIAVAPDVEGKGVGKAFVEEFMSEMAENAVDRICLTTDRDNNGNTNQFYRKCGFFVAGEFQTPEGRWMYEYVAQTRGV
jgi:ribosomal protein S18 acetylase RimI-like enzyme